MKCEVCGIEYKDTDRFCGMCGTPNPLFETKPAPEESRSDPSGTEAVSEASGAPEAFSAPKAFGTPETFSAQEASGISEAPADNEEANGSGEAYSFPDPTKPLVTGTPESPDIVSETVSETASDAASGTVSEIAPETVSGTASEIAPEKYSEADKITGEKGPDISGGPETCENKDGGDNVPEAAHSAEPVKSVPEPAENKQPAEYPVNRSFAAPGAIPASRPNQAAGTKQKPPKPKKEKRVCSLSAVVICIVIILILSVICGALGGLYLGEKAKVRKMMRQGSMIAPYSYSESYDKKSGE